MYGSGMSRIGKQPISIPEGVNIDVKESLVSVKGPKGSTDIKVHKDMVLRIKDGSLSVARPSDNRGHRSLHGTTRMILHNLSLIHI